MENPIRNSIASEKLFVHNSLNLIICSTPSKPACYRVDNIQYDEYIILLVYWYSTIIVYYNNNNSSSRGVVIYYTHAYLYIYIYIYIHVYTYIIIYIYMKTILDNPRIWKIFSSGAYIAIYTLCSGLRLFPNHA